MSPIVHPYFPPKSGRLTAHAQPPRPSMLAGVLLAAIVATLLVLADQVIQTWADGDLLLLWVASWTVVFAALAFVTPTLRQWSHRKAALWLQAHNQRAAVREQERAIREAAGADYRVLHDLQIAQLRSERG